MDDDSTGVSLVDRDGILNNESEDENDTIDKMYEDGN